MRPTPPADDRPGRRRVRGVRVAGSVLLILSVAGIVHVRWTPFALPLAGIAVALILRGRSTFPIVYVGAAAGLAAFVLYFFWVMPLLYAE